MDRLALRLSLLIGLALLLVAAVEAPARAQPAEAAASEQRAYRQRLAAERAERDSTFRDPATSPLGYALARAFEGLRYYPIDPSYRVRAAFEPLPDSTVRLGTSTGETRAYQRYGRLTFRLKGAPLALTLYRGPDVATGGAAATGETTYFLPFHDKTNGRATYGGGRYLDAEAFPDRLAAGDTVTLDFNAAYAPTCAYSPFYSCPLVPTENALPVHVEAGVKKPTLPEAAPLPPAAQWQTVRFEGASREATHVLLPAPPVSERQAHQTGAGRLAVQTHTLRYDPQTYFVAVRVELPAAMFEKMPPEALLAGMVRSNLHSTGQQPAEQTEVRRTRRGAHHTRVVAQDAHGFFSITDWYLAAPALYQLTVVVSHRRLLEGHRRSPFFERFTPPRPDPPR